ncbi:MAG: acyl-CoA dehydrogenase family protein, partial [Deltaproteobacteria bacterium]
MPPTSDTPPTVTLDDARAALEGAESLVERALGRAREITDAGKQIDAHQVLSQRVAYAATEARAARELCDRTAAIRAEGRGDAALETLAGAAAAELAASVRDRLAPALEDLGLAEATLEQTYPAERRARLRRAAHESVFRALGRHAADRRGRLDLPLDETLEQVRASVREFADNEVAPHAERIHRQDELVPESFIQKMSELGYFGL